jgi:hypothetical protein
VINGDVGFEKLVMGYLILGVLLNIIKIP